MSLSRAQNIRIAILMLRQARDILHAHNAPKACAKVRRALKSAEGAERNAHADPHRIARQNRKAASLPVSR